VTRAPARTAGADLTTEALQLFALAAAILALGGVCWLMRAPDPRERAFRRMPIGEATLDPHPPRQDRA
jgi:hypothetical protein